MKAQTIFLSWRSGVKSRRFIVGVIKRHGQSATFKYYKDKVEEAKEFGFESYKEFEDFNKIYEDVLPIFSQRIISKDRPDRMKFLSFWGLSETQLKYVDNFEILAFTQGWLPTDKFEFLGNFYFRKSRYSIVSDLAGLSYHDVSFNDIKVGDKLKYKLEIDNPYDRFAVAVLNPTGKKLGYIKQIHNKFVHKQEKHNRKAIIKVKAIEAKANKIVRIFLDIS
ncbi:HIRAN domain-containing protein [Limibacter armeniacum]|uniref:HIRAN domain-containing protein n=1 Tax=Limibacter armeniacum TaxID=466084 RepID=UPI002FE5F64D